MQHAVGIVVVAFPAGSVGECLLHNESVSSSG